jgi:carboxypeptidase Q
MKRSLLSILIVFCVLAIVGASSAAAGEMTAAEVVARYLDARGGAEAWRKVDSLRITGVFSVVSKRSDFTLIRQNGDLYRMDYMMQDVPAIRARDAAGPWMLNPWLQPEVGRVTEDPYMTQLDRESLFPLLLLDFEKKGIQVESLGPGDVEGMVTVDLKITLEDGQEEIWHLDAETFLEVAADSQIYDYTQLSEPMQQRIFFDDFRPVDGLMFPFQIEWEFWARLETMSVQEILINPEIDPALFSPPAVETISPKMASQLIELREQGLESRESFEIVRSLTTEVGPRFAGTPGDRAAVKWAVGKMQEIGLQNVRTEPVQVPHWIRGEENGEILAPFPQPMLLTALGGSVGTAEDGLEAEIVMVSSLEDLAERSDAEIEGKIVFMNQRMVRHQDGSSYGQTGTIRRSGPARAAEKGAAGVLIRSLGTGSHRFPHTGATRYEEDIPQIPAAALAVPDADLLEMQVASGEAVRFRLVLGAQRLDDVMSATVIGEIPGREKPQEIVLLGAHLDSWDKGTGAIDDGTGVATMLEVARLILALPEPPRRTIRVVLFANEEFGLSGARAYPKGREAEIDQHVLAMEADMGPGRVWRYRVRVDDASQGDAEALVRYLAPMGITWSSNTALGGADLIPLRKMGVPMVDLRADATYYFDYHHTDDDTLDKVDPADLAQNVAAYSVVAYWAAEREGTLGRPAVEEASP